MAVKQVEFTNDQWDWIHTICRFHIQLSTNPRAVERTKELMVWLANFKPEEQKPEQPKREDN